MLPQDPPLSSASSHLFFCPLSPAFVMSLSKGSQMSRANYPCEITSNFVLLEKGPALELSYLPSALPQASVI